MGQVRVWDEATGKHVSVGTYPTKSDERPVRQAAGLGNLGHREGLLDGA